MPRFSYQAINERGGTVNGVIEAESPDRVTAVLLDQGFLPSRVRKMRAGAVAFKWPSLFQKMRSVKASERLLFTKQFRTMVRAGVPILSILQVLENQTEDARLKKTVKNMTVHIREGASLYEAFQRQPHTFSPFFSNMVRVGESSGALPDVLDRLIYIMEHDHKLSAEMRSALQYPAMVTVFLIVAFFVLLTFVIPKFVHIFTSAGIQLPLPTRICMGLYHLLTTNWHILAGLSLAAVFSMLYALGTEKGKYVRDALLLKLPIISPLLIKSAMARFASIFSILYASGVSVLESVKILADTIRNQAISSDFEGMRLLLEEGRGISETFGSSKYFPPMVINMIAIGEASGRLDEMLGETARHYDEEVEYAARGLTESLGPLLTIGLAMVIGFFALAVFLPMWELTQMAR